VHFLSQYDWAKPTPETLASLETDRSITGWMMERKDHIVGYMIYQRLVGEVRLKHFVVDGKQRLEGIGTEAMALLKLVSVDGAKITMTVDEYNLVGQQFLRSCGFICKHWYRVGSQNDQLAFEWQSTR
jgi:ribosomal protein S18 acetylase RimI-like enzyme